MLNTTGARPSHARGAALARAGTSSRVTCISRPLQTPCSSKGAPVSIPPTHPPLRLPPTRHPAPADTISRSPSRIIRTRPGPRSASREPRCRQFALSSAEAPSIFTSRFLTRYRCRLLQLSPAPRDLHACVGPLPLARPPCDLTHTHIHTNLHTYTPPYGVDPKQGGGLAFENAEKIWKFSYSASHFRYQVGTAGGRAGGREGGRDSPRQATIFAIW